MKDALIGYTGFVGSNLYQQHPFNKVYNSKNIEEMVGNSFDLVVCAGVKAQKWFANTHPEEDLADIQSLMNVLRQVEIKRFVLISTIDVYPNPIDVNENTEIDPSLQQAYGKNRLILEEWVKNQFPLHHIIRLPGLVGKGIKKNFIFDLLHPVPGLINETLFNKILMILNQEEANLVKDRYHLGNNGYVWDKQSEKDLYQVLYKHQFTSLMFTDSRDQLQYYPLINIWEHIEKVILNNIPLINFATEPVVIADLYRALTQQEFENHLTRPLQKYDMRTVYGTQFNGDMKYLFSKEQIFNACIQFVKDYQE